MERYKKWIIVSIAVAAIGLVIAGFVTKQSNMPQEAARQTPEQAAIPPVPAGPMVDQDFNKVVPLEKLEVDASNPQALAALGDKYFESGSYNQRIY